MEPRQSEINELISGMLDGELSAAEARRIDSEFKDNPQLQNKLDELSALRSSLLKGRPTGRLPKDFARSIIDTARNRATEMGENSPPWLAPKKPEFHRNVPNYRQRIWIPVASIGAAVCLAIAFFSFPKQDRNTVAVLPLLENSQSESTQSATKQDSASEVMNSSLAESASPTENTQTAADRPREKPLNQDSLTNSLAESSPPKKPDSTSVTMDAVKPELVADTKSNVGDGLSAKSIQSSPKFSTSAEPMKTQVSMVVVLSISMDEIAIKNRALDTIFNKYGIAAVDDLAIDDSELGSLLSSGLAGSLSKDGVNVLFLKAKSSSIESIYMDVLRQEKDFPDIGLNIAMDDSVRKLIHQLSDIDVGAQRGVAKRLAVQSSDGLVSTFSQGTIRYSRMDKSSRGSKQPIKGFSAGAGPDEESYLLVVVKRADK